jgi:hypothetical protein
MTNFIKLTSSNFIKTDDLIPEAVLDDADPIHEIKRLAGLTNVGNLGKLQEYKGPESEMSNQGSNPSITAMEKINYQKEHDIQPGTPEWFRLWFSLPYLTGEKPW